MSILDKLFPKKRPDYRSSIPSWDEIVEHMQDKEYAFISDKVVRVLSSADRAKRIIILQSDHGYFKAVYEEIHVWDEDEWNYYWNDPDKYPAYWEPVNSSINSNSFYGSVEDAINAVTDSHEYKTYFT